ncbi:MAG: DivIVA domain-containing protein [Propionibacteriaceae bacterium]
MEWAIGVIVVVTLGVAALAASGGLGEMPAEPVRDVYRPSLPEGRLRAEDLDRVRFGITLRGYSMAQVDDLVARLTRELAERDEELAQLRAPAPAVRESAPGWAVDDRGDPGSDRKD